MPTRRIGELLVAEGLLTEAAVHRALGYQRHTGKRVKIGSILLSWDLVSEEGLLKALAALYRCEAVTGPMLAATPVEVARLLPAHDAIRLGAIPWAAQRTRIRVGFLNPCDIAAVDEVAARTGRLCIPGVVTEMRLIQAHRRFYGRSIPFEFRPILQRYEKPAAVGPAGEEPEGSSEESRAGGSEPRPPRRAPRPSPAEPVSVQPDPPAAAAPLARLDAEGSPGAPAEATPVEAPAPMQDVTPASPPEAAQPPVQAESPLSGRPAPSLWIYAPPERQENETVSGMWTTESRSRASEESRRMAEDLGDLAEAAFPAELPRVILFGETSNEIFPWRGRGPSLGISELARIRISLSTPSVFTRVASSRLPHFGPLERADWPAEIEGLLAPTPPPCVLFPIPTSPPAGFLYADRLGGVLLYEDFERLSRAASQIAALIAEAALDRETEAHY